MFGCSHLVHNQWQIDGGPRAEFLNQFLMKSKKAPQPRGAGVKAAPEPLFLQLHPDKETPDLRCYYEASQRAGVRLVVDPPGTVNWTGFCASLVAEDGKS